MMTILLLALKSSNMMTPLFVLKSYDKMTSLLVLMISDMMTPLLVFSEMMTSSLPEVVVGVNNTEEAVNSVPVGNIII